MKRMLLSGLQIAALAASPALATTTATQLAVTNAGFESPALASNGSTVGSIPGWTADFGSTFGVWHPNSSDFALTPEGWNMGWVSSAQISQTLATTIQPWTTYELRVMVGRWVVNTSQPYTIALAADGSTLASFSEALTAIPRHGFVERSVSFSTGATGAAIGQPLRVILGKATVLEADFDDVRVFATAVPEPESYALMAAGLGLLGLAQRARRMNGSARGGVDTPSR